MNAWFEMVRVRATPGRLDDWLATAADRLDALPCDAKVLRHGSYDGDIAVLLLWREGPPGKSREGLLLAQQLEAHGAIDHAIWIPREG
jgi:hypothetical protein